MLPVLRSLPRLVGSNVRQSVRRMATESGTQNGNGNILLVVGISSLLASGSYIVFSDEFWFNVPQYPDPEKVRPDKRD
ncbi:Hypp3728 [Branchiostoma lanceolatum]|uniref:Hypp3728 protein n=1 Tax=Branchiostoma lanceolatum TaxID=7740 RepID=A0A8K0A4G1_BRALA|nr:Hypp3728 [Branchiostoma lanceolatum]